MTDGLPSGFDAELERFRAEADVAEAEAKRRAELIPGYVSFLNERGVSVDLEPNKAGIASRDTNDLVLIACAQDLMENPVEDQQIDPKTKKRLQAAFAVSGHSAVWLELIDHVLPGEPLDSQKDDAIITGTVKKYLDREYEYKYIRVLAIADVNRAVGGVESNLSDAEEMAVTELGMLLGEWRSSGMVSPPNLIEEALIILDNLGLSGQKWETLLDLYFRPHAE